MLSQAADPTELLLKLNVLTAELFPLLDSELYLATPGEPGLEPLSLTPPVDLQEEIASRSAECLHDWMNSAGAILLSGKGGRTASPVTILVPLALGDEQYGLYVFRTPASKRGRLHLPLLTTMGNQAAVAIAHWTTYRALIRADHELKASEAQMMQAAKLAAIGELAVDIAHEMKNPIQVLMLHLEMIEGGRAMPNWPQMFAGQVSRLSEMAVRLMNFGKNVAREVKMDAVDLNRVVDLSVGLLRQELEAGGISLVLNQTLGLPLIEGNPHYLQQVFLNLLLNARDALPTGGAITIQTRCEEGRLSAEISDTGAGIPAELQEKIFKPFFTTKGEKATGLGLSICSKIVAQHGGKIELESEVGKGTTVRVILPALGPAPGGAAGGR